MRPSVLRTLIYAIIEYSHTHTQDAPYAERNTGNEYDSESDECLAIYQGYNETNPSSQNALYPPYPGANSSPLNAFYQQQATSAPTPTPAPSNKKGAVAACVTVRLLDHLYGWLLQRQKLLQESIRRIRTDPGARRQVLKMKMTEQRAEENVHLIQQSRNKPNSCLIQISSIHFVDLPTIPI